jgi:DNA-binding FadR family transcriptional regulator
MSRALILQEVTFRELWLTSMALEPAVVSQAIDNATETDLAAIESNVARTREAKSNPAAVAKLDAEYHVLLAKAAHNRVLLLAKEPSRILVNPTTEFIVTRNPPGIVRLIEAHQRILEAVRSRDREAALQWVNRHLRDWKRGFELAGHDLDSPVHHVIKWGPGLHDEG